MDSLGLRDVGHRELVRQGTHEACVSWRSGGHDLSARGALVALICTMSFGAAAVFSFFASAANAPWWTTAIFGVFALGSLHWLAECWVGRYQLSETGLRYVSVFTGTRFFKWDDLQSVKYAPSMRWFILKDSRGQVARISIMMTGLCEFALLVMEHTPNVNIGAYAMPILQKTARGEPPPVWP